MDTPSRRFWLFAAMAWLAAPSPVHARPGRYGPYATARRALEVANQFKAQGWRAVHFHDGNGWYVDVRR
jgi:predicted component of type VI protein secretion system